MTRTRRSVALTDLPLWAVPCVLGAGLLATIVALALATRHVARPVVDALAPVVDGQGPVGFSIGFLSSALALFATRWVWRRLWLPHDGRALAVTVAGLAAWFLTLVPWAVVMPNVRGHGPLSPTERLVIAQLPDARPGALTGALCTVALLVALSRRRRRP